MSTVEQIVSDQTGVALDQITDESHFVDDLGADSLDVVEIIMEAEDVFDVEIGEEAGQHLLTVGKLKEFIKENT